jgi:GGDEF domain-containing protein
MQRILQMRYSLVVLTRKLDTANQELTRLTSLDGLTGLANRRHFDETIQREWRRAARYKRPLALALVDVDNFKQYNDTYGHLAGDECLKNVANALLAVSRRPSDLVARYGGEEFALVLPETDCRCAQGGRRPVCGDPCAGHRTPRGQQRRVDDQRRRCQPDAGSGGQQRSADPDRRGRSRALRGEGGRARSCRLQAAGSCRGVIRNAARAWGRGARLVPNRAEPSPTRGQRSVRRGFRECVEKWRRKEGSGKQIPDRSGRRCSSREVINGK